MADIRNTLTIVDQATAVLRRVDEHAQRVVKSFDELDKVGRRSKALPKMLQDVEERIKAVAGSADSIAPAFDQAESALKIMVPMLITVTGLMEQLAAAANIASFGAAGAVGGASNQANGLDGVADSGGAGLGLGVDITKIFEQMGSMNNGLGKAFEIVANTAGKAKQIAESLGRAADDLINGLQSALDLAEDIYDKISSIAESTDFVNASAARIGILAPGTDTQAAWDAIYQTANDTYSSLEDTSNIVNRTLTTGLFKGEEAFRGSLKFAELLNKSMVATGTNAQQASSAIEQLMQGLGAGQLYWQDLRIILQQAPGVAMILAEGLNKLNPELEITAANLRQMSSDGELTAQAIIEAFAIMEDEINEMFGNMPRLFSQMEVVFQNMFTNILGYLGRTNGAMTELIARMEAFNTWLTQTEQGAQLLATIATIVEGLVLLVGWLADRVAELYLFLIENSYIVIGLLAAIAGAALIAGAQMLISWMLANWAMVLMIAIILQMVYNMAEAGMTTQEIITSVVTFFLTMIYTAYNVFLTVAQFILDVVRTVHNFFVDVIYGAQSLWLSFQITVSQIALALSNIWLWLLETVYTVMSAVVTGIGAVVKAVWPVIQKFVVGVLQGISSIAGALNSLPMVNIDTSGIDSAMSTINGMSVDNLFAGWDAGFKQEINGVKAGIAAQENAIAGMQNQYGNLQKEWTDARWDRWDLSGYKIDDPAGKAAADAQNIMNILSGLYNDYTKKFGSGATDGFWAGFDMNELIDKANESSNPTGGKIDSVGKIESDVNISDEDIKLLRDVAARDFLLNLSQVTPQVNVQFGDVRETADVNQLMDTIADMMEDALSTSLVHG